MKPLVSIGMPVYNGAKHLREALESLRAQTYRDFEIFISDNASTDATPEICAEYAKKDSRIRYVRQKENIGAIRNFGFVKREACGTYFMWAAHDDRWDPKFIETCLGALEADPSRVLAMSDFTRFDETNGEVERYGIQRALPSAREPYPRLKQHILFYLQDGKGVPIYGLWRRGEIHDISLPDDWFYFPVRFIFEALFRGSAGLISKTLYFKRAALQKSKIPPSPASAGFGRAGKNQKSKIFGALQDRLRKLFGTLFRANIRAILESRKLNVSEKMKLIYWQVFVAGRLFFTRKT